MLHNTQSPTSAQSTESPTVAPTAQPSASPTASPSTSPTQAPPTEVPTEAPTAVPSASPTQAPTEVPTTTPTVGVAQPPYWLVRNPSEVVKARQQDVIDGYDRNVSLIDSFRNNILNTAIDVDGDAEPINTSSYYYSGIIRRKEECAAYGAAATTASAQFWTTPLHVVRNRIMTKTTTTVITTNAGSYATSFEKVGNLNESVIDILQRIRQEEGIKGLFAGVTPRVGKAVISGAIQFATYEETKQSIRKLCDRK